MIYYPRNLSPDATSDAGGKPDTASQSNTPDNKSAIGSGDKTTLVNGEQAKAIGDESGAGAGAGIENTTNPQTDSSTIGEDIPEGKGEINKSGTGEKNLDKTVTAENTLVTNTGLDTPAPNDQEDTDLSTGSHDADAATG